jgi:23S rRNA (guanosine2251-2'-O)-methyltransferase
MERDLVVIAHNIRSAHNVGALLRACDGLGVNELVLTGYTPYPKKLNDERLPHVAQRAEKQIAKTALGAEQTVSWQYSSDLGRTITNLKNQKYRIVALEQTKNSKRLNTYKPPQKIALLLGEELKGIKPELLDMCDEAIEIPMRGKKESLNVSIAAAIALYHLRFTGA